MRRILRHGPELELKQPTIESPPDRKFVLGLSSPDAPVVDRGHRHGAIRQQLNRLRPAFPENRVVANLLQLCKRALHVERIELRGIYAVRKQGYLEGASRVVTQPALSRKVFEIPE